uniref:Uncharacterized protein n=1 Tax=Anguilla anguilla TaxID=7936 RepID=A0A0E9PPB3_ANGAN
MTYHSRAVTNIFLQYTILHETIIMAHAEYREYMSTVSPYRQGIPEEPRRQRT